MIPRRTLRLTRHASGSYIDGMFVAAPHIDLTITASVSPAPGDEIKLLPEGTRVETVYRLVTSDEVLPGSEDRVADVIQIDGDDFRVLSVGASANGVLPGRTVLVGRIDT